jgi:uncharacterized oxidoreductase
MKITGNTVFIPGSTSGLGLGLATALLEKGNTVVIGGRRTELLEQITAEHPGLDSVEIDTTDAESVERAAAEVLERHPDLNVVVAMSGIMRVEDWHHPRDVLASAQQVLDTNVMGPIRLLGAFLEHLQTRPEATFMTVSSGLAFTPLRVVPSYNASKAAIHMLTETLRLQLADTSVQFVELVPPAVATDLLPGHRDSAIAMPIDDYINEVVSIIGSDPDAREILVERVKALRFSEVNGKYDDVVAMLNSSDPHAASR